ncbi:serine protease-like protein, partial [Archaeoglobales archaeon]
DMQGSAQLAALTACDLLGLDFTKYDFFYIIEASSPIVGGPSAGGVMTIATISALKHLTINKTVFMTGMIYPDGFIGPVGGIPYKLEAAANNGAKIFLIPKGQRVVSVEEKKEIKKGPFVFITTNIKQVDLVEYGKKFNVNVVEVETVNDALKYYTGYVIKKPEIPFNITKYSDLLKKLAIRMKFETMELAKMAENEKAKQFIEDAEKNFKEGNYYTATSKYFTAKIFFRYQYYKDTIENDSELEAEFNAVENELNQLKEFLRNEKLGIESFQLYGAAEERATFAEDYLNSAKTSNNFDDALYYLAFSKERVESAKVWLSLLNTIKEDIPIKEEDIKKRAEFYLTQAQSIYVYAASIHGYGDLLNEAGKSIELSRNQLENGFYAGAAISAIDAITKASISIELIDVKKLSDLDTKIESAKNSAKLAIGEAEKVATPVLAAAYFEFAKTAENKAVQLSYYKLSERIAKLILTVSKSYHGREIVKVSYELPNIQPHPQKPKISQILETPGFEVILAISCILMVLVYKVYKKNR